MKEKKNEKNVSKYPIDFKDIMDMPYLMIINKLLKRIPKITEQFFYGMVYKAFDFLFRYFYTDCTSTIEFANVMYLYLLEHREGKKPATRIETYSNKYGGLPAWTYRVSRNHCINLYKKHRRVIFVQLDESIFQSDEGASEKEFNDMSLMGTNKDMNYYVKTGITREQFERLIALMANERYQRLIRYRFLDNLSYSEIAEKMGDSESLCRKTRYKAVDQLKNTFIKHAGEIIS